MITESLTVPRASFEDRTGWSIKPEGACKGDVCIPLSDDLTEAEDLDLAALAQQMNLPLVHDEGHGVWALGPDSVGGRTLVSAEAPDFTLPDIDGNPFRLSSLRGKKVLLYAWSPY